MYCINLLFCYNTLHIIYHPHSFNIHASNLPSNVSSICPYSRPFPLLLNKFTSTTYDIYSSLYCICLLFHYNTLHIMYHPYSFNIHATNLPYKLSTICPYTLLLIPSGYPRVPPPARSLQTDGFLLFSNHPLRLYQANKPFPIFLIPRWNPPIC